MKMKIQIALASDKIKRKNFGRVLSKYKMSVYSDIDSAPYVLYKPVSGSKIRNTFVWLWRDLSKFEIRETKMVNRPAEASGETPDDLDRYLSDRQ